MVAHAAHANAHANAHAHARRLAHTWKSSSRWKFLMITEPEMVATAYKLLSNGWSAIDDAVELSGSGSLCSYCFSISLSGTRPLDVKSIESLESRSYGTSYSRTCDVRHEAAMQWMRVCVRL